jgi:hypothetical protein
MRKLDSERIKRENEIRRLESARVRNIEEMK